MFWCIPSLSRLGSRGKSSDAQTRRKPISGPVELDDHKRRKQFQRHNQNPDAASNDTDIYYLVPNQNGPGKSIMRRNPAPPPPPPMDDSIDDMTQAPTTVAQKADTDWNGRTRGSPMTGASSVPMDDNFDAAIYTTPGVERNIEPAWQPLSNRIRDRVTPSSPRVQQTGGEWYSQPKTNHPAPNRHWHGEHVKATTPTSSSPRDRLGTPRPSPATNSSPGSGSKTVAVPEPIENYGDYGLYMREMERVFGQGDLQANLERKNPEVEQAEHHELGRVKSREVNRTPFVRSPEPGHTVTYNTRFETALPRGYNYGSRGRKKGPRVGQDYEVVERKVIEDTPEKTVTIATWRERVAMEADPNVGDTSSVHYMGPEDYAAAERTITDDSNLQSTHVTTRETQQSRGSTGSGQLGTSHQHQHQHPVMAGSGSIESQAMPVRQLPPTPPNKFIGNIHQPQTRSASSQSHHRSTPPPRMVTPERFPPSKHQSRSPRATRRNTPAYSTPQAPPLPSHDMIHRSPSPRHSSPSPTYNFNVQPGSSDIYEGDNLPLPRQSPLQESTPIRQSMSPIPFHPRQSQGSTISSIKSESVRHFERILDSCEPSLLHIAPILASLGITKEAHLKAVTRLSEEMRDREVREEALRLGVTFVEWAILLDKVNEL